MATQLPVRVNLPRIYEVYQSTTREADAIKTRLTEEAAQRERERDRLEAKRILHEQISWPNALREKSRELSALLGDSYATARLSMEQEAVLVECVTLLRAAARDLEDRYEVRQVRMGGQGWH
jgi:hypothetical protein